MGGGVALVPSGKICCLVHLTNSRNALAREEGKSAGADNLLEQITCFGRQEIVQKQLLETLQLLRRRRYTAYTCRRWKERGYSCCCCQAQCRYSRFERCEIKIIIKYCCCWHAADIKRNQWARQILLPKNEIQGISGALKTDHNGDSVYGRVTWLAGLCLICKEWSCNQSSIDGRMDAMHKRDEVHEMWRYDFLH